LAGYFVSCLLFCFEALKMQSLEAGAQNVKDKFVSIQCFQASLERMLSIFIDAPLVPLLNPCLFP